MSCIDQNDWAKLVSVVGTDKNDGGKGNVYLYDSRKSLT